jgi:predicted DNA-binding protein
MARPQKEGQPRMVGLTVRLEEEKNKRFAAMLALNGESASEIMREAIDEYMTRNEHVLNAPRP